MHRGLISRYAFTGGSDVEQCIAAKLNMDARHARIERKLLRHPDMPQGVAARPAETVKVNPQSTYNAGTSQDHRKNIRTLEAQHRADPAMRVRNDVYLRLSTVTHVYNLSTEGIPREA